LAQQIQKGNQMSEKKKGIKLAGGREVIVRKPDADRDWERLVDFFGRLPRRLRSYLRYNVMDPELCRKRLKLVDEQDHWRLIAELDDRIVAEGSMDREPFGWTHHLAHVRTVIDPEAANLGIGTVLLRRFVQISRTEGIERFYSEVLREHADMIASLEKEGFVYETTRRDYAKDIKGRLHDVVILSNDQSAVWRKLRENVEEMDIQMSSVFRGA
jgi:RimJ/RimL family protein N-acetyltransferase